MTLEKAKLLKEQEEERVAALKRKKEERVQQRRIQKAEREATRELEKELKAQKKRKLVGRVDSVRMLQPLVWYHKGCTGGKQKGKITGMIRQDVARFEFNCDSCRKK